MLYYHQKVKLQSNLYHDLTTLSWFPLLISITISIISLSLSLITLSWLKGSICWYWRSDHYYNKGQIANITRKNEIIIVRKIDSLLTSSSSSSKINQEPLFMHCKSTTKSKVLEVPATFLRWYQTASPMI